MRVHLFDHWRTDAAGYRFPTHHVRRYAGTGKSGFAEEVAANDGVVRLDCPEDIHRDGNNGGASSGRAAERIRHEIGDLPVSSRRLPGCGRCCSA